MKGALLLLIIGVVMCQHSLRGFPPEGTIPQGPRLWNHITALVCALACFFLWLELEKEERAELNTWEKNTLFGSFLSIFGRAHGFFLFLFMAQADWVWDIIRVADSRTAWRINAFKLCFRFKIRCRTRNAVQENIITIIVHLYLSLRDRAEGKKPHFFVQHQNSFLYLSWRYFFIPPLDITATHYHLMVLDRLAD